MRQIIFDTREQLSLKDLDAWKKKHPTINKKLIFALIKLNEADVSAGTRTYQTLNEIKIGSDCEDLKRLEDELFRMAMHRQKFPQCDLFLTLIETPRYFHTKKTLKIMWGLGQKYGVYVSHCQDSYAKDGKLIEVARMVGMEKVIAIARQTKPEQHWKLPGAKYQKGLSFLANKLVATKGFASDKAVEAASLAEESMDIWLGYAYLILETIYGRNKDGSMGAISKKILTEWKLL